MKPTTPGGAWGAGTRGVPSQSLQWRQLQAGRKCQPMGKGSRLALVIQAVGSPGSRSDPVILLNRITNEGGDPGTI